MSRDSQTAGSRGERLLPPRTSRFDRARTISLCECDTAMWSSWYTCLARRTRQRWLSSVQPLDGDGHAGSVLDHLVLHRPGDGFGLLLGFVQTEPVFHLLASLLALLQALLARFLLRLLHRELSALSLALAVASHPVPERRSREWGVSVWAPTRGERGGVGTAGGWRGRTCESCHRTQPHRLASSSPGRSPVNVPGGARAGQTRSAWWGWKSGGEAFSRKRRTFFPSGLPPLLPFAPLPSFPKAPLVVPKGLLPAGFFAVVLPIVAVGARDVNAGRRQNIVAHDARRNPAVVASPRHAVFRNLADISAPRAARRRRAGSS